MIAIALGQMIMSFNVASLPVAHGRHGEELRRSADHGRDRHRRLFDAGRRLRHARRQAHPALRRGARVPRRRCPVRRVTGADDIQPHRDSDDHRAGPLRRGRRCDRAVAGGADRRKLQRAAAGDGSGRARFGARRRGRAGVRDRRRSRHLHRLAPGVRNPDRGFGDCFPAELPAQVRAPAVRRCRSTSSASLLAAAAIILISFGFNNLNRWGLGLATPNAPFDLAGPVARADLDRGGHRAGSGLSDVDAPAPGGGKDAAARAGGDRFAAGAGGGLRACSAVVALEAR